MKVENMFILTVFVFEIIIVCISIPFICERNRENEIKAVKEYDKCLKENFYQRYDCARNIEGYTYQELDQLRNKYLEAK